MRFGVVKAVIEEVARSKNNFDVGRRQSDLGAQKGHRLTNIRGEWPSLAQQIVDHVANLLGGEQGDRLQTIMRHRPCRVILQILADAW